MHGKCIQLQQKQRISEKKRLKIKTKCKSVQRRHRMSIVIRRREENEVKTDENESLNMHNFFLISIVKFHFLVVSQVNFI